MFLVCSSLLLDIVMIDDEYMHMFVERLIQYSSELSGQHYLSMCLDIVCLRMHSICGVMW
jgi:hypothetical protein